MFSGNVISGGCMSRGLEFEIYLGGWLFSACWVISLCILSVLYL